MKRILSTAILLVPMALWAGDGNTGAEFLKIGAGARPVAMGDAQVALAEGALAALWNPAGLGGLTANEVLFSHNKWLDDITDQRFVAAFAFKNVGTVAVAYERLAIGDLLGFDAQSNLTGDLKSGDDVFSLSWGRNLVAGAEGGSGLFLGAGAKSITEKIAGVSASAFAADFGVIARPWGAAAQRTPWLRRSSLGVSVRNLGPGLKFDTETTPLPTEYALGVGHTLPLTGDLLTLGLDLRQVTGEDLAVGLGAEYWLKGLLALRGGYRTTDNAGAGLRAGMGFRLRQIQVDYAWSAGGDDLDAAHRLTLAYRFGPPPVAPGASADIFRDLMDRGRRHMDLKLYDRAVLDFNEALRINPNDTDARQLLHECGRRMEGADSPQ